MTMDPYSTSSKPLNNAFIIVTESDWPKFIFVLGILKKYWQSWLMNKELLLKYKKKLGKQSWLS